jgi:hypothetical protein
MADEVYATLAELKRIYKPASWTSESEDVAENKLAVASAMVRQAFRNKGADLEKRLYEGRVERLILTEVICVAVKRALANTNPLGDNPLGQIEFQSMTQTAGPVSTSVTTAPESSGGSLYFKKQELQDLGCPTTVFGHVSTYNPGRPNSHG